MIANPLFNDRSVNVTWRYLKKKKKIKPSTLDDGSLIMGGWIY
jgi:hypothetical protein